MKHGDSRKALIVGINAYAQYPLGGCENDARAMQAVLQKHAKMDPNFECLLRLNSERAVTGDSLRHDIVSLLKEDVGLALFYFSGHGMKSDGGLQLVCSNWPADGALIPMRWIMEQAAQSTTRVRELVIILDCCHAGDAGNLPGLDLQMAELPKGMTILAATTADGHAAERGFHGKFTQLLVRGLAGAAIDMVGHVTTASLYAYADSFLSAWEQQPVFKAHVGRLTALRYCLPVVPKVELRMVTELFAEADSVIPLNQQYLRTPAASLEKVMQLRILRRLRKHGYVEGTNGYTLRREALEGGGCRLTSAGRDLHTLVSKNKI